MVTTSSPIILSCWLFVLIWFIISLLTSVTTATLTLATVVIIFIVITFYLFLASHFTSSSPDSSEKSPQVNQESHKLKRTSDADDSSIQSRGSSSTAKGTCKNVCVSRRSSRQRPSTSNRRKSSSCSSTFLVEDDYDYNTLASGDGTVDDCEDDQLDVNQCKSHRRRVNHNHNSHGNHHNQRDARSRHQVKSRDEYRFKYNELLINRQRVEGDADKVTSEKMAAGEPLDDEEEDDDNDDDDDTIASRDDLIKRMVRSSRLSAYYKLKQHRQSVAAYGNAAGNFNSYYNQSPYYYRPASSHQHLQQLHRQQQQQLQQQYSPWYTGHNQSTLSYSPHNQLYYNSEHYNPQVNQREQQSTRPYYNINDSRLSSSRSVGASAPSSVQYSRDYRLLPRVSTSTSSFSYDYNHKNHLEHSYRMQQQQQQQQQLQQQQQRHLQNYYHQQFKGNEYYGLNYPSNSEYTSDINDMRGRDTCRSVASGHSGDDAAATTAATATGDMSRSSNTNRLCRRVSSVSSPPSLPMKYNQTSPSNNYTHVPCVPRNRYNRLRSSAGKLVSPSDDNSQYDHHLQMNCHRSSSSSNIIGRSKSPPIVEEDDTASSTASPSSILNSPAATATATAAATAAGETKSRPSEPRAIDANQLNSDTSTIGTDKSSKLIIDSSECAIVPPEIPLRPRTLPSQLKCIPDSIQDILYTERYSNQLLTDNVKNNSDINQMDHLFNCDDKSDTDNKLDDVMYGESMLSSNDYSDSSTICKNVNETVDIQEEEEDEDDEHVSKRDALRETSKQMNQWARLSVQEDCKSAPVNQIRRGPWSLSTDSAEVRIRKSRASLRRSNALTLPHATDDMIVDKSINRIGKNNSTESAVSSTDPTTDSCDSIHHQSSEEMYESNVSTLLASSNSNCNASVAAAASASGNSISGANSRIRPSFRKSTSLLKQAHLQNSSSFERDCSEGLSDAGTSVSRSLSRQTTFSSITKDNDRISARTGYLEISHTYDPPSKKLIITIIGTTELTLYPVRGLSGSISLGTGIDLSANNSLDASSRTVTANSTASGVLRRTPSPLTASSASRVTPPAASIANANTLTVSTTPSTLLTGYKLKKSMSATAGGQSAPLIFVRMALLPLKRNKVKTKSKCISFDGTVRFNEQFTFTRINPEEMIRMGCRFRVYLTEGKMKRQSLIGEANLPFVSAKPLQHETKSKLPLLSTRSSFLRANSRSSDTAMLTRSESTCSTNSMYSMSPTGGSSGNKLHASELMLSLSFNSASGRLTITVLRGSNMYSRTGPVSRSAPDSYVKLILVSSIGREIARNKTSIKKGQLNPVYKESFTFQVPLFELQDVTLLVHAYQKFNLKRKELIGWLALGANSSAEEQLAHWNDMMDAKGDQVCRWHVLHSSKS